MKKVFGVRCSVFGGNGASDRPARIVRERVAATLLTVCVVIVAFWEIMANRSRRPFQPFQLTASDLKGFAPISSQWYVKPLPVNSDPIEPNIAAYRIQSARGNNASVLTRLVHGYNMRDCMKIKGYEVEFIEERTESANREAENTKQEAGRWKPDGGCGRRQVWRMKSGVGDVSVWVTSILRVGDFSETDIDTRSIPFPSVGIPDDPGWLPRGLTLKSFRHPIRNLKLFLRSKWNASRRDLATFLGLRQPSWASDDLLTLVTAYMGRSVGQNEERSAIEQALAAHSFIYSELHEWRLNGERRGER